TEVRSERSPGTSGRRSRFRYRPEPTASSRSKGQRGASRSHSEQCVAAASEEAIEVFFPFRGDSLLAKALYQVRGQRLTRQEVTEITYDRGKQSPQLIERW